MAKDAAVAQLPQTSYQSLLTPYAFFGLGRTNNYIENLFVGSTKHSSQHFINLEMVIPNSKIVINPSPADDVWHKELYLRPGQWIPWVGIAVFVAMLVFAAVVLVLHLHEKVNQYNFNFVKHI
jgi:integrin alpha FG-GAP repeat containing protein 1